MTVKIRSAEASDYKGIIDCYTRVRGTLYYPPDMYKTDIMQKRQDLKFFVTENEYNQIIGIVAAEVNIYDKNVGFMGMLSVLSDYTSRGIGSQLVKYVYEHLINSGAHSVKANVVTDHDLMQKTCERMNLEPTGFLFCVRKNLTDSDKRSLVVYVQKNEKKDSGMLYIPDFREALVNEIYSKLEVHYEINSEIAVLNGVTEVCENIDLHNELTNIIIYSPGSDLIEIMQKYLSYSEINGHTLTVYLNINYPSATTAYNELIKLGFIFTGVDPLAENYEFFLFYYPKEVSPEKLSIKLTDAADTLFKKILLKT